MFGLSDAGAHCGQICDGSMTTSYMTLWARDREGRDGLPLESVVHQISQRPAAHFGWLDRGVVAPGFLADLNVIDLEHLECSSPEIATDLPAGGRRLLQSARGLQMDDQARRGDVRRWDPDGRASGVVDPRRPGTAALTHAGRTPPGGRAGPQRTGSTRCQGPRDRAQLRRALRRGGPPRRRVGGPRCGEGDRVALLLPNSVDFVVAALASLWIGAIFVPLSVADPEARLASIVADCTPAVVIRSDEAPKDGQVLAPDSLGGSPLLADLGIAGRRPGTAGTGARLPPGRLCHLHLGYHRDTQGCADRRRRIRRGRGGDIACARPRPGHPHAVRVPVPLRRIVRHPVPHAVLGRRGGHPPARCLAVPAHLLQRGRERAHHLHRVFAQLPPPPAGQPADGQTGRFSARCHRPGWRGQLHRRHPFPVVGGAPGPGLQPLRADRDDDRRHPCALDTRNDG